MDSKGKSLIVTGADFSNVALDYLEVSSFLKIEGHLFYNGTLRPKGPLEANGGIIHLYNVQPGEIFKFSSYLKVSDSDFVAVAFTTSDKTFNASTIVSTGFLATSEGIEWKDQEINVPDSATYLFLSARYIDEYPILYRKIN